MYIVEIGRFCVINFVNNFKMSNEMNKKISIFAQSMKSKKLKIGLEKVHYSIIFYVFSFR